MNTSTLANSLHLGLIKRERYWHFAYLLALLTTISLLPTRFTHHLYLSNWYTYNIAPLLISNNIQTLDYTLIATHDGPTQIGVGTTFTAVVTPGTSNNMTFIWNFGDGQTAQGRIVRHTYTNIGTFQATVIVSDGLNSTSASTTVDALPHSGGSSNWHTYTTIDGLLSNNIQALAYRDDPLDFPLCNRTTNTNCPFISGLWVGTDKGLTYLNGRNSVNFVDHLPAPDIRDLLFAVDGKLWIATSDGLTWLDDNDTPQNFTDDQWGANYLAGQEIIALTQDQGIIWVGTNDGLVKIDPASVQPYLYTTASRVTALPRCAAVLGNNCDVTLDNHLWFATDGAVYRLELTAVQPTPEPVIYVPLTTNTVLTITGLTRSVEGIWIASNAGIALWDGATWNPAPFYDGMHHLPLSDIRTIDVDHQGRIWLATNVGALYWHTQRHTWRRYYQPRDSIASNNVQTLILGAYGAAWFGTSAGLSGVNGAWELLNQVTTYDFRAGLVSNTVVEMVFDEQGRTWLRIDNGGVTVVGADLQVLTSFTTENGLASNNVREIAFDVQGRTWLGTNGGGVTVVGPDLRMVTNFTISNGLKSNSVRNIIFDAQGYTWLGTSNGVTVVGADLKVVTSFTTENGLLSNTVTDLVLDQQGRAWLSTDKGGVTVVGTDLKVLANFTIENELGASVVAKVLFDKQERTWLISYHGSVMVVGADLHILTRFTKKNTIGLNDIREAAIDDHGRMWLGTDGGAMVIGADLKLTQHITANNRLNVPLVMAMAFDNQGRTWLGTYHGGVTVVDANLKVLGNFSKDNRLLSNAVWTVTVDDQEHIWLGTSNGGVVMGADLKVKQYFTTANGLTSNIVGVVAFDKQRRTWLGTTGGGVTIVGADLKVIKTITTDNSLLDNLVTQVTLDNQKRTWLGTTGGVTVVGPDLNVLMNFTTVNGLVSNEVTGITIDDLGHAWVRTKDGGVTVVGENLTVLSTFTQANGLASNTVNAIAFDGHGRTWLSTNSRVTVVGADLKVLKRFTANNGLPASSNVAKISFDTQGRSWLAMRGGGITVVGWNLEVLKSFTVTNSLTTNNVLELWNVIFDGQGRTWLRTTEEVMVIGPELQVLKRFTSDNSPESLHVLEVAIDNQDRVWLGTPEGVTVLGASLQVLKRLTTENGLKLSSVTKIVFDNQGRAWLSGSIIGSGVTVVEANLEVSTHLLTGGLQLAQSGLVIDPQGRTWMEAEDDGVIVLGQDLARLAHFTSKSGLDSDLVFFMSIDTYGRTWFDTQGDGLSIFDPAALPNPWLETTQELNCVITCRLLDTRQLALTLTGGSLFAPPEALGYRLILTDTLKGQTVFSPTFPIGASGQQGLLSLTLGQDKPLSYTLHQLTLEVFDHNLATYRLPPLLFDVQSSPILTLLQVDKADWIDQTTEPSHATSAVSPLATMSKFLMSPLSPLPVATGNPTTVRVSGLTFPTDALFPIQWHADDADLELGDVITFTYRWGLPNVVQKSSQLTLTQGLSYTTMIRTPKLDRGAADEYLNLELSVTDKDGNSSPVQFVYMTIVAPTSYQRWLAPYMGALMGASLLLLLGLVMLARNSGLPFNQFLGQGITQWLSVGLSYRRYQGQCAALTALEQLLLLLAAPKQANDLVQWQTRLAAQQTPVPTARVEVALASLVRQQLLTHQDNTYLPTDSALLAALQGHQGAAGLTQLTNRVRREHPLFATSNHFFPAAGFTIMPLADPLAFLCQPAAALWEPLFSVPVYVRLIPDHPLDQEAVATLNQAAQAVPDRANVIFALIDHTPTDSGWIAIGALRADGIQVIPIDDAFMQKARSQQRERQELQAHLRRFLGRQRDLYNVRDPVADRLNFFGREAVTQELLETVNEGHPLALFGLRKLGKSSLLQVLGERVLFPVAHVDLQAGVDLAGLYARILAGWQRTLPLKATTVTWTPPTLTTDPSSDFTAAVNALLAYLAAHNVPPRLGIFVDEIDLIMPTSLRVASPSGAIDAPAPRLGEDDLDHYLTFARTLRGLVQETGQLSLLVAGVDARLNHLNRWGDQQNPFYQFFREEYLGPLSEADCIQMVRNIGRQMGLVYGKGAAEHVATVSGGHPFLARQLCSVTLRLRSEQAGSEITLDDVQAAAEQFVRDPGTAANLDEGGMWGEVTNPALWPLPQVVENAAILTTLAQGEAQSEPVLLAAAQDRQARERSLTELEQRAVLGRLKQLLHIQFGLFRVWIRRYKLTDSPSASSEE